MAGNLSADASLAVEHHLGEHHAVERFAMLESEQDGGHAILAEGAGGNMYLGLLGLSFVLFFHCGGLGIEEDYLFVWVIVAGINMNPPFGVSLDADGVGQSVLVVDNRAAHLALGHARYVKVDGLTEDVG